MGSNPASDKAKKKKVKSKTNINSNKISVHATLNNGTL